MSLGFLLSLFSVVRQVDLSPFNEKDLYRSGFLEESEHLRRIVATFTDPSFAVTDADNLLFLDKIRHLFDTSLDGDEQGAFRKVLAEGYEANGPELLEMLLSVGVDPDKADADGQRASHACAMMANVEAARIILLCRPDMKASNNLGETPLEAAGSKFYYVRF